ncbi:hypothetical protein SAMN05421503_1562 [Terribacillus aidingensis]|uniref:DUF4030 domain-containing protein n=1 Tax=Terribacillus aidingensis TaxID=586416 RepID=A0A285NKX9_9BACI|nr:DUF4179 domain-containing protein [Terribacillus aidingensis]SNZ10150.1 hypothetical protein SAMN05421503_1562 [Terribacillus aidingensis]
MQKRDSERNLKVLEDDMQWDENRKDEIRFRLLSKLDNMSPLLVKQEKSKTRRLYIAIPSVIVALCFLIVGTAYISPALADKIFHVPIIGELARENSMVSIIQDGLDKADYKYDGINISYPDKSIAITLNKEEKESKQQVKHYIEQTLFEENVQGFDVHIAKEVEQEHEEIVDNVDQRHMENTERFSEEQFNLFDKTNLSNLIVNTGTNYTKDGRLVVNYQVYDSASKNDIIIIKNLTRQAGKLADVKIGDIKIDSVNKQKEQQDMHWSNITDLIGDKLMSDPSYHVDGIAYSVYPSVELTIKTNIESTKDPKTQLFTADLEKEIRQAIEDSEEAGQEDYQIIIRDKNNHRIN